jgi:hypothetical protein
MTRGEAKQEFFNILESGELRFDEQSFIDKIYDSFENRSCESCKFKYVVDSMTTECQHNDSPIDYVDLDCFPTFSCNVWELKQ